MLKDGLMVMDDSVASSELKGIWESVLREGLDMTEDLALADSGAVLINEDLKVDPMTGKKNRVGLALCHCPKMKFRSSKKRVIFLEFSSSAFVAVEEFVRLICSSFCGFKGRQRLLRMKM